MLALVDPQRSSTSSEGAALSRDYLAFDRQRIIRRQYTKAFGGMALLVVLGAAFNRVPRGEALLVAALLSLLPLWLSMVEVIRRRRLVRRLDEVRAITREQRVLKNVSV